MRRLAPIDPVTADWIDQVYQQRLASLLTIGDHIGRFIQALDDTKQLDNTFVPYMSDNGFQLAQHRIRGDKRQLYEHDIHIPFIVRGPGVAANVTTSLPVLNIDVAPTINHIATGKHDDDSLDDSVDGVSILPLLRDGDEPRDDEEEEEEELHHPDWRTDFLISYHGSGEPPCGMTGCPPPPPEKYHCGDCWNNTYHCVRGVMMNATTTTTTTGSSTDYIYCRFEDDENFVE